MSDLIGAGGDELVRGLLELAGVGDGQYKWTVSIAEMAMTSAADASGLPASLYLKTAGLAAGVKTAVRIRGTSDIGRQQETFHAADGSGWELHLARAVVTRIGAGPNPGSRHFVVDFDGGERGVKPPPKVDAWAGRITNVTLRSIEETDRRRVSFDLDPEGEEIVELGIVLQTSAGDWSEKWVYRWTPRSCTDSKGSAAVRSTAIPPLQPLPMPMPSQDLCRAPPDETMPESSSTLAARGIAYGGAALLTAYAGHEM